MELWTVIKIVYGLRPTEAETIIVPAVCMTKMDAIQAMYASVCTHIAGLPEEYTGTINKLIEGASERLKTTSYEEIANVCIVSVRNGDCFVSGNAENVCLRNYSMKREVQNVQWEVIKADKNDVVCLN